MIGHQLGQYEIVALLGKGGMATVYRARQVSINRDVAIKVIRPDLAETHEFLARFRREAQIVASLSHPFILKVFDYGEQDDLVYLVTELVSGGSLADLIKKEPLPLDMANQIIQQVASALDFAHQRGIIHRDLKPHNVLIDGQGNALLTDFGVAKLLSESTSLTQSGTAMGTPSYMSPEQWQGKPLDSRTDVYALGIMAFEMLSGTLPFKADTPFSMMHMHINEAPLPLKSLRTDLPLALERVINTAIAKNPDQRYHSAGLFANAFKAATAEPVPARPKAVPAGNEDKTVEATSPVPTKKSAAKSEPVAAVYPPMERRTNPVRLGLLLGVGAATLVIIAALAVAVLGGKGAATATPIAGVGFITSTGTSVTDAPTATTQEKTQPVVNAPTETTIPSALPTTLVPTTSVPASNTPIPTPTTVATSTPVLPTVTLIPTRTSVPPTRTLVPTATVEPFVSNLTGWHLASKTGEWKVTNDGLQGTLKGGDSFYRAEETATNFLYEADFIITGGSDRSSAGLIFRSHANPIDGCYVVRVSTANGGQINFFKFFGGEKNPSFLQFTVRRIAIAQNTLYHLLVDVRDQTIIVFLDGKQMFSAKDSSFESGHFGLDIYDATVVFQNIKFTET